MARRVTALTGRRVRLVQQARHNTNTSHWLPDAAEGLLPAARDAFVGAGVQVVSLMLGTGDAFYYILTPPDEYAARLTAIIDYLRAPGMEVVLHAPPFAHRPESGWTDASSARLPHYHRACTALTKSGVALPGDTEAFRVFQQDLGKYSDDGIHPSPAGRQILSGLWAEKIADVAQTVSTNSPRRRR